MNVGFCKVNLSVKKGAHKKTHYYYYYDYYYDVLWEG